MAYKQLIIARKDLGMSAGKLSAQASHASMAFLTTDIAKHSKDQRYQILPVPDKPFMCRDHKLYRLALEAQQLGQKYFVWEKPEENYYLCMMRIDADLYDNWINDSFTKVVCEAKNQNHLLKAKKMAEELGMLEGEDFFLIEDNCRTELLPEQIDENGIGRCLTCIGFKPFPEEIIDKIGKKYQLYK